MAPCTTCDDNSLTTTIGSSMCACSEDSFSINGYDTPNRCIKCPDFSYTDGIGTKANDASEVCRCGVPSVSSSTWWHNSSNDDVLVPSMFRSDTGFAPCNQCTDINSYPLSIHTWHCGSRLTFTSHGSCLCNVNFKSNGLSCEPCSEGSSTMVSLPFSMNYCNREFTYYDIGQTFCTCQQGYYSSSGTDIEGCIKCPLSTTSASVGGTACDYCDIGYYSIDGKSSSGCIICPIGETTSSISTAVKCDCDKDFFSPTGKGPFTRCNDGYGTKGQTGQIVCSPLITNSAPPCDCNHLRNQGGMVIAV